jgi:hypothetical protein
MAIMVIGYLGMLVPTILTSSSGAYSNSAMDRFLGLQLFGIFGGMACFGFGLFLALALWAVLPVVLSHVAATNSFSAAFHIKDWWKILRVNLGGFLVTLILIGGLYMVMVLAAEVFYMTIVLCIVIPFLFAFIFAYLMIMANVLFAQAYREAVAKLAAQVA